MTNYALAVRDGVGIAFAAQAVPHNFMGHRKQMRIERTITSVVLAAALLGAGSAQAAWMSVDASAPYGNSYGQGQVFSGHFDIAPLLGGGGYGTPYDIGQALIRFAFDDRSVEAPAGSSISGYAPTAGSFYSGYQYTRTQQDSFFDPYDEVTVLVTGGGHTAGNGAGYYSYTLNGPLAFDYSEYRVNGYYTYSYRCGFFSTCYASYPTYTTDYYYTQHRSQHAGYAGDILFEMPLYGPALADLAGDGLLQFSVQVNSGAVALIGAELLFDIYPNDSPALDFAQLRAGASVPAPGTLASVGVGLALLGWERRRQRRMR